MDKLDDVLGVGKAKNKVSSVEEVTDAANVKRGTTGVVTKPDRRDLAKNMDAKGILRPDYPHATHHIVAFEASRAEPARKILEKYGININDVANGVHLPTVKGVSEAPYHRGLHTKEYYDAVNERLERAKSRDDVLDILQSISEELQTGTFMK